MTRLQDNLFVVVDLEIEEAKEMIHQGEKRLNEAVALKEVLVDLLVVPPDVGPEQEPEPNPLTDTIELRRQVLSVLDEQTPHSIREIAGRLDLPDHAAMLSRINRQVLVLRRSERVKLAGARVVGNGHPANFYVRVSLNGGTPVEREIIWP